MGNILTFACFDVRDIKSSLRSSVDNTIFGSAADDVRPTVAVFPNKASYGKRPIPLFNEEFFCNCTNFRPTDHNWLSLSSI